MAPLARKLQLSLCPYMSLMIQEGVFQHHCHKLQPPIKWHDSASYLFPVNKAYVWANVLWEWILHHTDLNNGANDFVAKDCDSLLWINCPSQQSILSQRYHSPKPLPRHWPGAFILLSTNSPKHCWDSEGPQQTKPGCLKMNHRITDWLGLEGTFTFQ